MCAARLAILQPATRRTQSEDKAKEGSYDKSPPHQFLVLGTTLATWNMQSAVPIWHLFMGKCIPNLNFTFHCMIGCLRHVMQAHCMSLCMHLQTKDVHAATAAVSPMFLTEKYSNQVCRILIDQIMCLARHHDASQQPPGST